MTILTVTRDVCATVGIALPSSIFSGITAIGPCRRCWRSPTRWRSASPTDLRDWTQLKKVQVFTGDGSRRPSTFLPTIKRMLLTSEVWRSTSALQPMTFVPDANDWMQRRALNRFSAWGEWTIIGNQMLIWPVMGVGVTATFPYLDKNCVALASGGYGDAFQATATASRSMSACSSWA
jgi:hypothetical protein